MNQHPLIKKDGKPIIIEKLLPILREQSDDARFFRIKAGDI
ncbi:hypothetical protein [Bacillus sonorensis]|nr:hypothetical protein [Bacillus sonorensis]